MTIAKRKRNPSHRDGALAGGLVGLAVGYLGTRSVLGTVGSMAGGMIIGAVMAGARSSSDVGDALFKKAS